MKTYLIPHTNKKGTNVAQASITAHNEKAAVKRFEQEYPERKISGENIGIKGESQ